MSPRPHQLHPRRSRLFRASAEQPVDEPARQLRRARRRSGPRGRSSSGGRLILDAVIIAQPRRRGLPPPFGRDPFGPFGAGDVMHGAPPHEAARHAFGRRVNDVDRFGPVEQALGRFLSLRGGSEAASLVPRSIASRFRLLSKEDDSRDPPARPFGQMAFFSLRPPHRARSKLDRQPVDQPRDVALARWLLDQAVLRRAERLAPVRLTARRHRNRIAGSAPPPCQRAGAGDASARGWELPWRHTPRQCCRRPDSRSASAAGRRDAVARVRATSLGDQPFERLARSFGMGRRLLQPKRRARRRLGRRGGQRLILAPEQPVERIDDIFAPRGTAAPAPAAALPSARRWS